MKYMEWWTEIGKEESAFSPEGACNMAWAVQQKKIDKMLDCFSLIRELAETESTEVAYLITQIGNCLFSDRGSIPKGMLAEKIIKNVSIDPEFVRETIADLKGGRDYSDIKIAFTAGSIGGK